MLLQCTIEIPVFRSTVCCGILLFRSGRVSKYQDSADQGHSIVKEISQQFRKSIAQWDPIQSPQAKSALRGTQSRHCCEIIG